MLAAIRHAGVALGQGHPAHLLAIAVYGVSYICGPLFLDRGPLWAGAYVLFSFLVQLPLIGVALMLARRSAGAAPPFRATPQVVARYAAVCCVLTGLAMASMALLRLDLPGMLTDVLFLVLAVAAPTLLGTLVYASFALLDGASSFVQALQHGHKTWRRSKLQTLALLMVIVLVLFAATVMGEGTDAEGAWQGLALLVDVLTMHAFANVWVAHRPEP